MVKPWDVAVIGDYLDFKNGLNKGKEYFGYGTPIVNYTDVYKKRGLKKSDINGRVSLSKEEIRRFDVRKNDVFFTRTSETPDEVGMSSVMLDDVEDCVFSGFVLRGRPKNDMFVPEYCKYCFSTEAIRNAIITGCTYTTRALTNGKQLSAIEIPVPPKPEQEAIAAAISDMDELISNLEKLIAKKKAVKQGAMQELLTGKRRLPGFNKKWKIKRVDSILTIGHGKGYKQLGHGDVPVYGTGGYITSVDKYLYDGATVCIGRKGTIDCPQYHDGKIWTVDTLFYTHSFQNSIPKFVFYCFCLIDWLSYNEASGVPSLSAKAIGAIELFMPDKKEQKAISDVLSDMDAEIENLEKDLAKYKKIKSGMMSELLTGRIRLV